MRRIVSSALVAGVLAATVGVFIAAPASAHEVRTIGPYSVEVGFGDEPPYAGFPNSVQFILTDAKTGKPVTNLGTSLKVAVTYGKKTEPLALVPNFEVGGDGVPGDYRAWFIPTAPGTYAFHFTGSIGSTKVDETFTSSSTTFDNVVDPREVQFPAKAPSNVELNALINRQNARLESSLTDAKSQAHTATIVAVVAVILGIAGIGLALAKRRP
jgi:hypothetical protein